MKLSSKSQWRERRKFLENNSLRVRPYRDRATPSIDYFYIVIIIFNFISTLLCFKKAGQIQASKINSNYYEHKFSSLPKQFNNFKICHLSDLHFDECPEMIAPTLKIIEENDYDLLVITGDFTSKTPTDTNEINELKLVFKDICAKSNAKHGIYAVLGNHDSYRLVDILEEYPIKFLINEYEDIKIENESIRILGTDDVHYFYHEDAEKVLEYGRDPFSISLVHSPELVTPAAKNNINLYLSGHTHAGQIAFPGGRPIVKRIRYGRAFVTGVWKLNNTKGFTSSGVGTSGLNVRYFTTAEVAFHTLSRYS